MGATTASLRGKVTGVDGTTPLAGIRVTPYLQNQAQRTWEKLEPVWSGSDGTYTLPTLQPGVYTLEFADESGSFLAEFYNNSPNLIAANSITLEAGTSVEGIFVSLQRAGFEAWMESSGLGSSPNTDPSDDFDGDGLSNAMEHAFGTNPASPDSGRATELRVNGSNVVLEFLKLNSGASYSLQEKSDLLNGTWVDSQTEMTESPDQSGVAIGYTRMRSAVPAIGRKFFRVRATY
jgi:hypothetical protein